MVYMTITYRLYKKTDLNREKNGLSSDEKFNSISEFEVFKSNHRDTIFIETIISACTVTLSLLRSSLLKNTKNSIYIPQLPFSVEHLTILLLYILT